MNTEIDVDPSPQETDAPIIAAEPTRKRGRPPLSDEEKQARRDAKAALNGGAGETAMKNSDAPTRRSRPISSKPSKTDAPKMDVAGLAKQIQGLHQFAALASGLPVIAISEKEAEILAKAAEAIAKEYGFEVSGKTGAAVQLFAALGIVYGPRVIAVAQMQKVKKVQKAHSEKAPENSDDIPHPIYEGDRGSAFN